MNFTKTMTGSHTDHVTSYAGMLRKLQRADRKQAALYLFCNFISLLLITAYSAMIFSPTVLLVLPEGGDSRKQMMAIYVLALFGCVIFTIYASNLFFRKKSRQLGALMALGASRRRLAPGLFREVLTLSGVSSLSGILAGIPFTVLLWNGFRLLLVDSTEMTLVFDYRFLWLSTLFFMIVVSFSCLMAYHYLKRTDIMDIVHEEHKNEPVRAIGRWCGPCGFLLLLAGAVAGYLAPVIYKEVFSAYPPIWLNLFYVPVFVGLYMIMLHTVIHGWRSHRKHPYQNLISRSMMKFQGRQTVNNLLVSTVLIAGAVFAIFYLPMLSVGQLLQLERRPYGYLYHYPDSQDIPGEAEVRALAADHGLSLTDYLESPCIILGCDAWTEIEDERGAFHIEHRDLGIEGCFLSESDYYRLTGQKLAINPGFYYAISNTEETGLYNTNSDCTLFTNMTTRETLPVTFEGYTHCDFLFGDRGIRYNVLNDADFAQIAQGLDTDWRETLVVFNVAGEDSYDFAAELFYTLVGSYDPEYAMPTYYDRVEKIYTNESGEIYWGDTDRMTTISFDSPDSTDFRMYWRYMPKFTELDRHDFARTYAVFLMMFLFISIICMLAAIVICYTRCMTIAMNNRYVFDDLRRLGASPQFLSGEIKSQSKNVFIVPVGVGMGAMYLLYCLIMFGNDGSLTQSEAIPLIACLGLVFLLAGMFYLVYRYTVRRMAKELDIW